MAAEHDPNHAALPAPPGHGKATFDDAAWARLAARYGLTRREREVVQCLFDTAYRPAIAKRLYISPKTVDTHLAHVFRKVGVETRGDLILAFVGREQPVAPSATDPPADEKSG